MKTVAELVQWLEDFAPSRLAESWDNVGLLWGDPAVSVGRLMTCLTVTRITAEEAVAEEAGLIVSHHPVLFRGVKRVRRSAGHFSALDAGSGGNRGGEPAHRVR